MVGQEACGHIVQRAAGWDAVHRVPGDGQPGVGVQLRAVQGQQLGAVLLCQLPYLQGCHPSAVPRLAAWARSEQPMLMQALTKSCEHAYESDSRPTRVRHLICQGWSRVRAGPLKMLEEQASLESSPCSAGHRDCQTIQEEAIRRWQSSARADRLQVPATGATASPTLRALCKVAGSACYPLQPLA